MMPYTICMILLVVAVFMNLVTRNRIAVYYMLLPAFVAIFLMLLGNTYGPDIGAYKRFFGEVIPEAFWERGIDQGYSALMALVKGLGGEFELFLMLINIAALWLVFNTFDKYSPYIALSWLLYFVSYIGYNHTILRQGLAIGVTLFSFRYIVKEQVWKFVFCLAIASLFHSASLLFIPAYWIGKIKWSEKTMYILMALTFPLVLLDTSVLIVKLASLGGMNEALMYAYFDSSSDNFERAGLSLGLGVRLLYFCTFALVYDKNDRVQRVLLNLYSIYLMLYFPLSSVSMLSARGLDYYKIFDCIMLPYAIYNAKNKYYKVVVVIFILGYNIYALPKQYTFLKGPMDCRLQSIIDSFCI